MYVVDNGSRNAGCNLSLERAPFTEQRVGGTKACNHVPYRSCTVVKTLLKLIYP